MRSADLQKTLQHFGISDFETADKIDLVQSIHLLTENISGKADVFAGLSDSDEDSLTIFGSLFDIQPEAEVARSHVHEPDELLSLMLPDVLSETCNSISAKTSSCSICLQTVGYDVKVTDKVSSTCKH